MGMVEKNVLKEKYIERLNKIFEEKGWKKEENEISYFDRFCERLAKLETDEDRDFILELTKDYLLVTLDKYEKYLIQVMENFFKEESKNLEKIDTIHIFPLINEEDLNKIKSSKVMLYLLQGIFLKNVFLKYSYKKQLLLCSKIEDLENNKDEIKYLILIDDYIGSGETTLDCIRLLKENKINTDNCSIITLVVQKTGFDTIVSQERNIKIYYAIKMKKGITDKYPSNEIRNKIEQMKKISKLFVKKRRKYLYLGYKASEGLVSMIRTPNNTFPFFWYKTKDGEYGPFSRDEAIKFMEIKEEYKDVKK